jgi:DNA-binding NarL/FixJ family response regulator
MVSIGLVDDDAFVRAWVRQCLRDTEFRVAGEASSTASAADVIATRRPDVLLIDYRLPDGRATEFVRSIRRQGLALPVLVMTATPEQGLNEAVVEAGGQGVILKRGEPEELLQALRSVVAGDAVSDPDHPRRSEGVTSLSPREREILHRVAEGATNREIAGTLGIGTESVKTFLSRAFAKLGVRNRIEAVAEARRQGLL